MQLYAFIQTHTFCVEPYLYNVQGYAPFIASPKFTGKEIVRFMSKEGKPFPDIQISERALTEFSKGKWFLSDEERLKSATCGALPKGDYVFSIATQLGVHNTFDVEFIPSYVSPVSKINIRSLKKEVEITWDKPKDSDSFWIFLIRADSKSFFDNLIPITENKYINQSLMINKQMDLSGEYRIAIRANQNWKTLGLTGFSSESWGLSKETFSLS